MRADLRRLPSYAIIIRATTCRGADQAAAMEELHRRGLWLTAEQKEQAAALHPFKPQERKQ